MSDLPTFARLAKYHVENDVDQGTYRRETMNAVLKPDNAIVEFNEFESQLAEFKNRYDDVTYDLTVPEEEKQARADRLAIGKVIAELDRTHKKIKAPLAEKVSLLDTARKHIKDDLLSVQGKIKSQIQAHEDAIQAHAEKLQGMVDEIIEHGEFEPFQTTPITAKQIQERIDSLEAIDVNEGYEHRKADATLAQIDTTKKLEALLADRVKYEADQAELEKLRKETEERERKDREEAIRKGAAEKAKKDAEAKAKADVEAAERKVKEAEAESERIRVEAKQRAEREAKAVQEESDRKAKEAEERGRKQAEEAHAKKEAKREQELAKAEAAEAKAAAKKELQSHRNKIHKAAKESFIKAGFRESEATDIVTQIKDGEIANVEIVY